MIVALVGVLILGWFCGSWYLVCDCDCLLVCDGWYLIVR